MQTEILEREGNTIKKVNVKSMSIVGPPIHLMSDRDSNEDLSVPTMMPSVGHIFKDDLIPKHKKKGDK